jgi:uncharacterized protein (DUF2252 family)
MSRNVIARIQQFNQGRDGDRLHLKYQKMRADCFAFFRGTCHLFYEDWSAPALDVAPAVWICGDLHLENFGSFKGDDRTTERRQVYFDINDFDEAALAPCTWELARFLTSVYVASYALKVSLLEAKDLCEIYLQAYRQALVNGKACSVETDTADGMIEELLEELQRRKRGEFLKRQTAMTQNKRQIEVDGEKTYPISAQERSRLTQFLKSWATTQPNPDFYQLLDVAGRLAGTSSLGVPRYLLLVKGKGSPDRNYLLDLKHSQPSSLQPYLTQPQPPWRDEAQRIVETQTRVQATPPALLHAVTMGGEPYVLRELQPTQDKLSLHQWQGKKSRLEHVVRAMGRITAWGQLRSGGRDGSALADDLIAFATSPNWHDPLLGYAEAYARQVETDYKTFR